jgi:FkbM family methyltransferase
MTSIDREMINYFLNRKTIESDGRSWPWPPNRRVRKLFRRLYNVRKRLIRDVEIFDGASRYRFQCRNFDEFSRCMKMFIKEPGTCDWIKQDLIPGEIFYDIGANIGVYTVLAAKCTGENGRVFAFEPHCGSFSRLLENIHINNLERIVTPCNFALYDQQGFFPFNYFSGEAATSHSQIGSARGDSQLEFQPEISELKYSASIDSLIATREFPPPHHIKIDVDGSEFAILRGMNTLMKSSQRPKSIQVEIDKPYKADIMSFMENHKYVLTAKHHTRAGLERISAGQDPEDILYNAIFRPA